jgi:pyruvate dehydrogenase E2 component (dihydrolipoamide acetyltransferase)
MAEIVTMPKLGFDMAEGTLVRWVIDEGKEVQKGAILAEIETDKATVEVESAYAGVLARHLVSEGEVVPVNTPIAVIGAPGEKVDEEQPGVAPKTGTTSAVKAQPMEAQPAPSMPSPVATPEEESPYPGGIKASPVARHMAEERGIPLSLIQGTGPGGRITKKDIEAYLVQPSKAPVLPAALPVQPVQIPQISIPPSNRAPTPVSMPRLRSIIGRRMTEAKQRVPHFYVTHEYDLAPLMALREQVNQSLPEGEKTSVNDFIIKAAALTLREFPNLNASLDEQNNQIIQHGAVNIGVAVAVEGGLLTVVCRDADLKPLRQVASEVRVMVQRARDGKVRPDDIEGSTFSVSNLGMYDVEHFIAIINPPEAAILAAGSAREVPVIKDGQVVPGWRMKATISVDHRVSDGAEAARYLQSLAKYLERPISLLL